MSLLNLEELRAEIRKIVREEVNATARETPEGLRLAADMTTSQLAKAARLSVVTIRQYERGLVKNLRRETLRALSSAIGVDYARYVHACTAVQRKK